MRNDGIWEIDRPELVTTNPVSGDAHASSLIRQDIHGGLLEKDYVVLKGNPRLAKRIAESVLDAHFPDSYRDDILQATGIDTFLNRIPRSEEKGEGELGEADQPAYEFELSRRLKRDPGFRPAVLGAYREQCAVCAFDVRVAGKSIAVEAAHIHWHADAGPGRVCNGLALCSLHHRLFDRGAFTLSADDLRILVAQDAGGEGSNESLRRFERMRPMVLPRDAHEWPAPQYLRWHHREVFRGNSAGG